MSVGAELVELVSVIAGWDVYLMKMGGGEEGQLAVVFDGS